MAWRKSSPELVELFERCIPDDSRVERRQMFGFPSAFVNGNLFMGLHQENFILRLGPEDRETMTNDLGAVAFEPMPGKAMREYVCLPAALMGDVGALKSWIDRSRDFAATVPSKKKRTKKKRTKK
ncbi:MAG: TfoX/Sxy family protein [Gammaproteobacteria bacterium]